MLTLEGVSKAFGGVQAVRDVSFGVERAECHALVGANGAGKSTLLKILSGVVRPDAGRILLDGRPVEIRSPHHAHQLGIGLCPQETTLCDNLSIAENLFLGTYRILRPRELAARARERLTPLGLEVDPLLPVGLLSVAQKQLVQIARALVFDPKVLALDEPTSSLSGGEVEHLFRILGGLKARGVTLLFVSHRLKEIQTIADRATVLRDGERVATVDAKAVPREELVRHMAGRDVDVVRAGDSAAGEEALSVKNLRGVSFTLRKGEVLGLFGLVGAGRTELARALFGIDPAPGAEIAVEGRRVALRSPAEAIAAGLALVPEDRKLQGLVLSMTIRANASLASMPQGPLHLAAEEAAVRARIEELRVRCTGPDQGAAELSGGNQQKVVLARWLETRPTILILDEPTKGVDLAAKAEIQALVRELARRGAAVLLISSELEEVRAASDRILVMKSGSFSGEFPGAAATDQALMSAAT
jgi:rhamnose transport system ATP-binding protein